MQGEIIKTRIYGMHLTLDGYGADPGKLNDLSLLFETLNELPAKIGMKKIGFPHLAQFKDEEIAGISGIIMIVESHISIHTYPNKEYFSMDVYSCRQFDHQLVIDLVKEIYQIKEMEINVIDRGKNFPVQNLHSNSVLCQNGET
jgi:S-adenosylmethionine decarboxylase